MGDLIEDPSSLSSSMEGKSGGHSMAMILNDLCLAPGTWLKIRRNRP